MVIFVVFNYNYKYILKFYYIYLREKKLNYFVKSKNLNLFI